MGFWGWFFSITGGFSALGLIAWRWPNALGPIGDIASSVADAIDDD